MYPNQGFIRRRHKIVPMKEIHVFDMDDTLLTTPTFADMIRNDRHQHVEDFLSHVKNAFMLFMSKSIDFKVSGDFIVMIGNDGKPVPSSYLDIFEDKIEQSEHQIPKPETFAKQVGIKRSSLRDILKCLKAKDRHIVVSEIRGFHADANTIGKGINHAIVDIYNSAQNKMILTGRKEALKPTIIEKLQELGLHLPNQGLYCYPENATSGIQDFKMRTILDSIEKNGWESVHFYEDKAEWLNAAANIVHSKYPSVLFTKHHVTNVHDGKSL